MCVRVCTHIFVYIYTYYFPFSDWPLGVGGLVRDWICFVVVAGRSRLLDVTAGKDPFIHLWHMTRVTVMKWPNHLMVHVIFNAFLISPPTSLTDQRKRGEIDGQVTS